MDVKEVLRRRMTSNFNEKGVYVSDVAERKDIEAATEDVINGFKIRLYVVTYVGMAVMDFKRPAEVKANDLDRRRKSKTVYALQDETRAVQVSLGDGPITMSDACRQERGNLSSPAEPDYTPMYCKLSKLPANIRGTKDAK
jgi:hypothetical protein